MLNEGDRLLTHLFFFFFFRLFLLLLGGRWEQLRWDISQKSSGSKQCSLLGEIAEISPQRIVLICTTHSATTPADFEKTLHDWELQVSQDPLQFKQLYLFTFNYVKSASQKSMEVEVSHGVM